MKRIVSVKSISGAIITLFINILIVASVYGQKPIEAMTSAKFLQAAATTGMNTVALGNLGEKRLQNEDIRNYALEVLNAQTTANVKLKVLAKRKKVRLPDPMTIPINSMQTRVDTTSKDTATISPDSLKTDFDREYLQMAIDDHQKAIALFEQGTQTADSEVRNYARKNLPLLRKHLKDAQRLSAGTVAKK